MNSNSQEKKNNPPLIFGYIIAGGLGSLLMLFLIQKSLPLNYRQARQYQQNIQAANQTIFELERSLSSRSSSESDRSLGKAIDGVDEAVNNLKEIPDFIPSTEQRILRDALETKEVLLASQFESIARLQNARNTIERVCSRVLQWERELSQNPQAFGRNLITGDELFVLLNNLIDTSVQYCREPDSTLVSAIRQDLEQIEILLDREQYAENRLFITQLTDYIKSAIAQSKELKSIEQQLNLTVAIDKLQEIELKYLDLYYKQLKKINAYRVAGYFLLLLVVVLVAYKINNNLATTNRNIVKILEGFTKELETKVEERTAQLEDSIQNTEAALAQAQYANKAKSRFLANMSHELRTPLNAILGFTQLMTRDASLAQEQQENLKIINRSGEHLLRLINDILEMSKIEVGQISLNESQFDLHLMLKSIEEMLRLKAQAKNIALHFQIASNVPHAIYADEGKLRQIIINLLGNALKFTKQGSATLSVKADYNASSAKDNIDFLFSDTYTLNFTVEDTGPGIDPEEMAGLFTPFEQTKIGRISNEGTGLGLSICHKFVELMGGELKVESTPGQGSVFFFDILIRVQDKPITAATESAIAEERKIVGLASKQEYRILAVDDVPASRLLLSKLLTGVGFAVKEARDGQQAIALWREWQPDLILMDMRMPVIDGYEATKIIKSEPGGAETIIIALTASAFEEERVVILSVGCDDFMRKPFKENELLEKIGQYLDVKYLYEYSAIKQLPFRELTPENLTVMPEQWRSQLYNAAAKVDNQEIYELLSEIPDEYESLAKGLADLAEQFRCDKIIDLANPVER